MLSRYSNEYHKCSISLFTAVYGYTNGIFLHPTPNLGLMKNDVENGVTSAAPVVHGSCCCGAILVRDVDVHFHVLLRNDVSDGQILDVRTGAGVFAHAQCGSAFARNVRTEEIVDFFVVNFVA